MTTFLSIVYLIAMLEPDFLVLQNKFSKLLTVLCRWIQAESHLLGICCDVKNFQRWEQIGFDWDKVNGIRQCSLCRTVQLTLTDDLDPCLAHPRINMVFCLRQHELSVDV